MYKLIFYIIICNIMGSKSMVHYPRLDTILMVEDTLRKQRISIKETAMALSGEKSNVPNIQPDHFIFGRVRENCPAQW